jgi:hypothetical protein
MTRSVGGSERPQASTSVATVSGSENVSASRRAQYLMACPGARRTAYSGASAHGGPDTNTNPGTDRPGHRRAADGRAPDAGTAPTAGAGYSLPAATLRPAG